MIVTLKETIYVTDAEGTVHTVRHDTRGVLTQKSRAYKFYDNTRTISVVFDKETCLTDHNMFVCKQELQDQEVNIREVFGILQKNNVSLPQEVIEQLQSL